MCITTDPSNGEGRFPMHIGVDVFYQKFFAQSNYKMKFFFFFFFFLVFYLNSHAPRGKQSFDQAGVGATVPAEVKKEDDEFALYRKRMMLAYRFRPNPLVSQEKFQSDFVI